MAASDFLVYEGSSAISDYQSQRLVSRLGDGIVAISARWNHYICLVEGATLSSDEEHVLHGLLSYGDPSSKFDSEASHTRSAVYVFPRPGTISPWSSQATGISHVCGLGQKVKRIERGKVLFLDSSKAQLPDMVYQSQEIYDRMTQCISMQPPSLEAMFAQRAPQPLRVIPSEGPGDDAQQAIAVANTELGLGLTPEAVKHLVKVFHDLGRPPTDVELFTYAQINSEHCRHTHFGSEHEIDGVLKPDTLFGLIKSTHTSSPEYTVSAYADNGAIFQGFPGSHFSPNSNGEWAHVYEEVQTILKVETHNHPTQISPFPGAATGSGGEIRDEGACGRGSAPQTGLTGFMTSAIDIPGDRQPWEFDYSKPAHTASSLEIMIEGPLGSSQYNNEFGRPCTAGFWRTLLLKVPDGKGDEEVRGYHKPIMLAGGLGRVRPQLALKKPNAVPSGGYLVVIGGPAMLIGLGGGAASSKTSSDGSVELDFASVQRGNAEVQRRCHEVIQACNSMGTSSPIKFIHDVGAGGLSNALPELVHDCGLGANFELREIDSVDRSLSPMQIWCCEAQERYVLALTQDGLNKFKQIAARERCAYSVVGRTTTEKRLTLMDRDSSGQYPIDLPMESLFSQPPKKKKVFASRKLPLPSFDCSLKSYTSTGDALQEAVDRVLRLPAVGSKSFLITIGDRSVGGLTIRDPFVGPWQVPVADCSVSATSLTVGNYHGVAMAMGERPTSALISPAASAKMAVAESLLNIAAADVMDQLTRLRLSCNWQACPSAPGEGAALYEAVEAICTELCPQLKISIPVGKDSLSMATRWQDPETKEKKQVISPMTLVATAYAPVRDFRRTWTPTLRHLKEETWIIYVDLANGHKAMGGSCLAQCFQQVGDYPPDVRSVQLLKDYFDAIEQLHETDIVIAYHDISDGGLFVALVEMAIAGRCGLEVNLDSLSKRSDTDQVIEALFNEELGAVFQIRKADLTEFKRCFATSAPKGTIQTIGRVAPDGSLTITHGSKRLFSESRVSLQQKWSTTSYNIQRLRDNPTCADQEFATIKDTKDPGLSYRLTFDPAKKLQPGGVSGLMSSLSLTAKPRAAVLREEGSNGHAELALALQTAGFIPIDVTMTDILAGRFSLTSVKALAGSGGFSYGDVLGAGRGWAQSILLSPRARSEFSAFFQRPDIVAIGICNAAQLFTRIAELIPGAAATWPVFTDNDSRRFEARFTMVRIPESASPVWFSSMQGSALPIVTSHGEGKATFPSCSGAPQVQAQAQRLLDAGQVGLQYVDNQRLQPTERFPANPNGSPCGITGVTAADGRVLALMPHPERTVLGGVASWLPLGKAELWGELGPWARLFASARRWIG